MSATAVKIGLPSEMLTRLKRLAEMKGCSLEEVILQILDRTTPLLPEEKPPPNEASHGN